MVEPPQLEKCHRSLSGEDALGKCRGKTAEPLSKHSSNSSSGPVSSSSATQSSSSDVVSTGRGRGGSVGVGGSLSALSLGNLRR